MCKNMSLKYSTASLRIVKRNRMNNVIVDTVILIEDRANVAESIRWIRRCPAVMLAVSHMARGKG